MNGGQIHQYLSMIIVAVALFLGACAAVTPPDENPSARNDSGLRQEIGESALSPVDLIELWNISDFFLSPDGMKIAFRQERADVASNDYVLSWWMIDLGQERPLGYVGDGGDLMLQGRAEGRRNGVLERATAAWSPGSDRLAYLASENGAVQLWLTQAGTPGVQKLTDNPSDILSFAWSTRFEGLIYFTVGASRESLAKSFAEEAERGFLMDERFWPVYERRPLVNTRCLKANVWTPTGFSSQNCEPVLWVYDLNAGVERRATPSEGRSYKEELRQEPLEQLREKANVQHATFSPQSGASAWFENRNPETYSGFQPPRRLGFEAPDVEGRITFCEAPECDGNFLGLWFAKEGDSLFYLRSEGAGRSQVTLYQWVPGEDFVRKVFSTTDRLARCVLHKEDLICLVDGPREPVRIASYSLSDGARRTLVSPNRECDELELPKIERLEWRDEFGNDTFGHLVYPKGYAPDKRYPLVVVQYRSRGLLRGGTGDEYPIFLLADAGFMVLSFDRPNDYKLYEKYAPFEAEAREWDALYERRRALTSLETIIERLDERALIDINKVAITGLSDGAETVDFALINTNRFAAAISSGSFLSPTFYHIAFAEPLRRFIEVGVGVPGNPDAEKKWNSVSIGLNADKIRAPLLLHVADRELLYATPNFAALKYAGHPIEMHVFPDEYHIKWQPVHRYNIYRRNIQWLKFWLQNEEVSDPVDPGQYIRWRKLREQHEANLLQCCPGLCTRHTKG